MGRLFQLANTCAKTGARVGTLATSHGSVPTPVFLPVGSQGTVKTLTPDDLRSLDVGMVLCNTYHLYLRPGTDIIRKMGGLHRFMAWDGPILTDSGGFQVFSLGHLRRVSDEGALFRSHVDGSEHFLTPELAIRIQEGLGADVIMVLDECPPYGEDIGVIREAMDRSHLWAERCQQAYGTGGQALFAIVHGGTFDELRQESVDYLTRLDFPGYAIGGLSLGEPKELTYSMVDETARRLPNDRPRYLMGVGSPEDLVECVALGIDMFDSALPTRLARNGALFGQRRRLNIMNSKFRQHGGPVDPDCDCYTCSNFSAAYLHHLFKAQELLAYRLATIHNLRFIMRLMERIRQSIQEDSFDMFRRTFLEHYQPTDADVRVEQKRKWLQARRAGTSPD
jgi:queuine tRNA-ribosyltransferase